MLDRRRMMYGGEGFVEGIPPLTLPRSRGKELKDYKIYGKSIQNGTQTPDNPIEVQSVGERTINIWDEEWENGTLDGSTGETATDSTRIRSKNFCPVLGNLYAKDPTAGNNIKLFFYNASKSFLSSTSFTGNTVVNVPSNAYYFKFIMAARYGTTYNHDICINLSDASVNGTYEPYGYKIPVYSFDSRYWGFVDLGSLTWAYRSTYKVFRADLGNYKKSVTSGELVNAYISSKYSVSSIASVLEDTSDKVISLGRAVYFNNSVVIKDTSYTDATAFKTALNGVYLYYELATAPSPLVRPTITNIYLDEPLRGIGSTWDYIDFKNQKRVNAIGKMIVDGTEDWVDYVTQISGYYKAYTISKKIGTGNDFEPNTFAICDCFNTFSFHGQIDSIGFTQWATYLSLSNDYVTDLNTLKTWLSQHNVTTYYKLAVPTEQSITLSSVLTQKGNNILTTLTTVMPNSMSAKYIK